MAGTTNGNGNHDLPFAKELFEAADRLRGSVESAEYKHLVLGLLFLKYISDAFDRRRAWLEAASKDPSNADYFAESDEERQGILEDRDEYISENVFWVPAEARWPALLAAASLPDIGERIDNALDQLERDNPEQLRGVLPKVYARAPIQPTKLGALVGTIAKIGFGDDPDKARDILGRTYEYFIKAFARSEGHRGGEFYTPASVTRLLVEMLEPYEGRVLDPACGSGGLFIQSAEFVKAHGGRARKISLLGQENNQATWRICRMNLAIHGLGGDIRLGDSLLDDKFPGTRADFVIANPPFNLKKWGARAVAKDARWTYGDPPDGNANYGWIQHFIHHLAPDGRAGFVMAVGSLGSDTNNEGAIRAKIIEDKIVDCIVALPAQLFFTTPIQTCLWFIDRNKEGGARRDETLFIDARGLGRKIGSTQIELTGDHIEKITAVYRQWRGHPDLPEYGDIKNFCRSVGIDEIRSQRFALTPGTYLRSDERIASETLGQDLVPPLAERLRAGVQETETLARDVEDASTLVSGEDGPTNLVPLTKIARFVNGGAFTKHANGKGRPIIRIKELNGSITDATPYSDHDAPADQIAKADDLLFSWSGSLDVYRWRGPDALINQHIFKVIPEDGIPSWFVEAWLLHHLPSFQGIARDKATTMGHIQRRHLDEALVVRPTDGKLLRLARVMEPLILLGQTRRDELAEIDALRLALMREMTFADDSSVGNAPDLSCEWATTTA